MATAIITDERTVISTCNTNTGWVGTKSVDVLTAEPSPIEGTGSLGMQVSNATENAYITVAARSLVNAAIYVWITHRAELDTTVNGGVMIQIGDGTNRIGFHVAGSDVSGFRHESGPVNWQCIVLDGSNLPTAFTTFAGSRNNLNLNSITQIGVGFKTLVKSVGGLVNCFWDIIRQAAPNQGIVVTGGTIGDKLTFADIALADRTIGANRAHGIIRQLGTGLYGIQGSIKLGAATGTANTFFADANASLVFEDRKLNSNKYVMTVQSASTNTTSVIFGIKTGSGETANGSAGVNIVVPPITAASFVTGSNVDELLLYGSTFDGMSNGLTIGTLGATTEAIGTRFTNCTMAMFQDNAFVRNCTFSSYKPFSLAQGAMRYNSGLDIKRCEFNDNTNGSSYAGIYIDQIGTYSFDELSFSNNDFDVRNASGGLVTVNAINGSNPGAVVNEGSSTTVINNVVTFTITNIVSGSEVRIYSRDVNGDSLLELAGTENLVGTTFEYTYNFTANFQVNIVVLNVEFIYFALNGVTLTALPASIPIQQIPDKQYARGTIFAPG